MSMTRRSAALAIAALGGLTAASQLAEAQQPKLKEGRERHPRIRQAIRALEGAKDDLQRAAHDFGGHRAEALEACNNAIRQLQQALQFDKG